MMKKPNGIRSTKLSVGLFGLAALIMAFFVAEVRNANLRVAEQTKIEENRRRCEAQSQELADASDYLTSEVWHYVATQEPKYLENYWKEVNETKRRDTAIGRLNALSLTQEEKRLVLDAKSHSDELIEGEAWAMRLAADSAGMPLEQLPPRVAAVQYQHGEEQLSAAAKQQLASDYIFGPEYSSVKLIIKNDISSFRNLLRERKNAELSEAVFRTGQSLRAVQFFMLALILLLVLQAVLQYYSFLRPFHFYTRDLEQMKGKAYSSLVPMGARETRSFAAVFNQIYADWQEQQERLEQERYRFRVALENTSVIVYEYDYDTDTYTSYGTLEASEAPGGWQQSERIIPNFIREKAADYLSADGVAPLQGMLLGTDCSPVDLSVRSCKDKERFLWARVTGTPISRENGTLSKLIGKVTNIQSEKEKEFALEDEKKRDGLTGLYRREPGIRQVRSYMAQKSAEESCCIMMLDMDDFGSLNEAEGAAFADAVLQNVADILRANTGRNDIRVRLGGDEFMVFLKGCSKEHGAETGRRIASQIQELSERQNMTVPISASVGMCNTDSVNEYAGLYRCAESTLEYVKEHDKGQAVCYMDASNELGTLLTQMYPGRYQLNKIDRAESAKEDLPSFALDLLGKSKNLNDAIFLLLTRVGNVCRFDRITIVEINDEYLSCQIVHQWTRHPEDHHAREIQYLSQEELVTLSSCYDADGLSEVYTIPSPLQLTSVLHAAIWNYGRYAGCMSFELRSPHQWTEKERCLISELTKIISSFTLKARADAVSQAKTDFLSRMSHEIRTPMNAITGMTTIAKTVLTDPEKELDCLNKIEYANKHLMNLINDVLDMSRIESGKMEIHPQPMELSELIEKVDTLVRPQAEKKGVRLDIENSAGSLKLMADELHLNQVLVNLLGNAVKFTGEDGRITFRIESVQDGQEPVHRKKEAVLRFSVTDNGIGISESAQSRIFNAFEQAGSDTASNYGGTGLGLTISSRLVQLMGSSLEVESVPGKGSLFHFTLHLSYAPEEKKQPRRAPAAGGQPAFDPHGKRLLLVEDNALNREIAQEILSMHGFDVKTASDGLEALRLFQKQEAGYYDAILMDIRMPVMDGMEATRRIRTSGKADARKVPIIAMTANAFDEDMKKSLENGMDGHLSKPIDVDKLLNTLSELIYLREHSEK